jgi:hypothetical protein
MYQRLTSLAAAARVEEIQPSRMEAGALSTVPVTGWALSAHDRDLPVAPASARVEFVILCVEMPP